MVPTEQFNRLQRAREAIAWLEVRGHVRSRGPGDFAIGHPFIWNRESDKSLIDAIADRAAREAAVAAERAA